MSQVTSVLEVLWSYERMKESTILSPDEKRIIQKELYHSLPHVMHSTQSLATREIVASHLDPQGLPSITPDEVKIDRTEPPIAPLRQGRQKK
jgi:hypothetical protein